MNSFPPESEAKRDITNHTIGQRSQVDTSAFLEALASVCAPVSVITCYQMAGPHGTTVTAFSSLSLEPPLVLVSLDRRSDLLAMMKQSRRFGVNVLAHDQQRLAVAFSRKGRNKFHGIEWSLEDGLPRLKGAGCWLACECQRFVCAGDHVLAIGLVGHAETIPTRPLLYRNRAFGTVQHLEGSADPAV